MKGSSKRDQVCRSCSSTAPVPQDTVTIDIKRPAKKGFRQRDLEGVSFLAGLNLSPEPVQVLVQQFPLPSRFPILCLVYEVFTRLLTFRE